MHSFKHYTILIAAACLVTFTSALPIDGTDAMNMKRQNIIEEGAHNLGKEAVASKGIPGMGPLGQLGGRQTGQPSGLGGLAGVLGGLGGRSESGQLDSAAAPW